MHIENDHALIIHIVSTLHAGIGICIRSLIEPLLWAACHSNFEATPPRDLVNDTLAMEQVICGRWQLDMELAIIPASFKYCMHGSST